MSAFKPLPGVKPSAVVELPPSAFRDDWRDRPTDPVLVGLRHVPAGTDETARAEAAKYAVEMHPKDEELRGEAYDDALMRWVVAKATCMPGDALRPFWKMPEDTVREALTSQGVRLVWDRYERMLIETSPLDPALDDDEARELSSLLEDGALDRMASSQALRARKLLRFVLADLRAVSE